MPRLSVVIRYAAQNQCVSGILVRCRTVPDVNETSAFWETAVWSPLYATHWGLLKQPDNQKMSSKYGLWKGLKQR